MGQDDIVALLQENLEQEQHTLGEVMKAALKMAQRARERPPSGEHGDAGRVRLEAPGLVPSANL